MERDAEAEDKRQQHACVYVPLETYALADLLLGMRWPTSCGEHRIRAFNGCRQCGHGIDVSTEPGTNVRAVAPFGPFHLAVCG